MNTVLWLNAVTFSSPWPTFLHIRTDSGMAGSGKFGRCVCWGFPFQHSAHIAPGRDGLFNLVRSTPPTLKYEPGLIVAENDYVIVHGRFSGTGRPRSWIAADVVRVADGVLAEHWDVLQDERPKRSREAVCRCSGPRFPSERSQQLVQSTQPEGSAQAKCSMARWDVGC
jgi:SnoaL-like protein